MYRIPSTLNGDLDYTQSLIDQFKAGEIQAGQLKSNRVPMGIYEQRKNQHYTLRLRCAGGLVTPEQLAKIAFVGHQLSTSHLHSLPPDRRFRFTMLISKMPFRL